MDNLQAGRFKDKTRRLRTFKNRIQGEYFHEILSHTFGDSNGLQLFSQELTRPQFNLTDRDWFVGESSSEP